MAFNPTVKLDWKSIQAKKQNKGQLPNAQGVYAFVVRPDNVNIAWCGYILYVGKTEAQSFQTRFQQYFDEVNASKPRFWVGEMLKLWENNLYYYFAALSEKDAGKAEDELLEALMPPNNERFPGKLGKLKKEIYR
ncbi:hypothetical protein [Verrucomicrobium sp. BvORR106]|uniref:hypothetical protein n=1 Tax=Verrucomicrobium sp. BvORR106 TaxID=1403819 RepID=UPI0005704F6F|nr:hypothetical protein [Verrucomicrobium sp. BvORR106]